MLCDEEYQEYYWCGQFQRLSNNSRIEEISLKCVYDKEHGNNRDDDTPAWIFNYSSEQNRDSSDKYSENWYKTGEKCDTSESEDIGENIASVETELTIEEPDNKETHKSQYCICNSYFALSTKYESETFLYFFEEHLNISVKK